MENAARHGAAGMLLVTGPRHSGQADDLRLRSRLRTALPDVAEGGGELRSPGARIPSAHVSPATAAELLASTGRSLRELQSALDGGARPRAVALAGARASLAIRSQREPRALDPHNVAGFLPGSDPAHRDEWVVIGAHYDHLGKYEGEGDTIYNGADDNASGTAGMLELAQAFASRAPRPKRSILFVGFSGEEKGLLGSRALVEQEILPIERVVFMLNLDMIGRNDGKPVAAVGDGYGTGLHEATDAANREVGLALRLGGSAYSGNSDHHPFYVRGVPFLFFFTGTHADYHQLSDHADKIAYEQAARSVQVAYGVVDQIASASVTPAFIHHVAWLGAELTGATFSAVEEASRGAQAGIRSGDVVVAVDGAAVHGEGSRSGAGKALGDIEPGRKVTLTLERAGARQDVVVARARRGRMGIVPGPVEDDERARLGLADDEGVKVRGVDADGPAGPAGLREGDVILRIAGLPVGLGTLLRQLDRIGAGEQVTLLVARGEQRESIALTLAERRR
jgi:hypothetical protein